MVLDLHTGFSVGRGGDLVFPSLKNFLQFVVIYTVKGFSIINVFLKLSYFLYDPADVGNLICGSSAFSLSSLNIWKFMVHILLKPSMKDFEHYFASM